MSCAVQQSKEDGDTFDLDHVKGPVKLKKAVELEPFEQKEFWGYTKVRGHSKRVMVCTESEDLLMKGQVMCANHKLQLLPHNPRVRVMLRNLSSEEVRLPAKTTIEEVSPCNVVPPIWKPESGVESEDPDQIWTRETEVLFEELGLNEPKDWMTPEEVLEAKKRYHMIFSKNDLDLGKTDQVKYRIKVTDPVPFKERYRRIPLRILLANRHVDHWSYQYL